MKRTALDDKFDRVLENCSRVLFDMNQKAINEGHPDIQSVSCYLIEAIETAISNRENV